MTPGCARGGSSHPTTAARLLRPGWPLAVLYYGFPLWWALGLAGFVFFLAAVPMAVELLRRSPVRTPRWFGLWLLFLVWVLLGVSTLWAQAPGTQTGAGPAKLINFGLHGMWYLAATVVLLYVHNLTEQELPARRIERMVGSMFVVTALFGLAGMLAPDFEFTSLAEHLVPAGLTHTDFLHAMVHPALASASDLLGYEAARPIAPFMYANAWGNNLALYAPMFVAGWLGRGAGWRAVLAPVVLVLAAIPVVGSLNRAMWVGIVIALGYTAVRLAIAGRTRVLKVMAVAVAISAVAFLASPLYQTVTTRAAHPHSNERRANLAVQTLTTAASSPVIGYGDTRRMQGGFASIASGDSARCQSCAPPSLGTQGFLWFLVLGSGFVGAGLCLLFLLSQLLSSLRESDPESLVAGVSILMSLVFFAVYDSLGSPLFTLMIAIGLHSRRAGRDRRAAPAGRPRPGILGRRLALVPVAALLGAVAGGAVSLHSATRYSASTAVLMARVPAYVDADRPDPSPPDVTVDTDAQLGRHPAVARAVLDSTGIAPGDLPGHLAITATPLTRVLHVTFTAADPRAARRGADAVARTLPRVRSQVLATLQPGRLRTLQTQLADLRTRLRELRGAGTGEHRADLTDRIEALSAVTGRIRTAVHSPGRVIVAVHGLHRSRARPLGVWAGSGAALGLLLGLGAVLLGGRPIPRRFPPFQGTSGPGPAH